MPRLESLTADLRFAARLLAKSPGFTAVAVATLALAIGANTAMVSIVDAVLLRPLPFPASERILVLGEKKACCEFAPTSPPNLLDDRRLNRSFAPLAAFFPRTFVLTRAHGAPLLLRGTVVTPDYFDVFRLPAAVGRTLEPALDHAGGPPAAVLSDGLWHREFAADRRVVGRALDLGGRSVTVVGVMPPEFAAASGADLWVSPRLAVPEIADDSQPDLVLKRGFNYLRPIGRLRPGVTAAGAQRDIDAILQRIQREDPDSEQKRTAIAKTLLAVTVGDVGRTLWTLVGAVGLILLIACANLANLLLARATGREREMAIRASLGASPGRLARQLLVESALLGAAGGVLGLGLAVGSLRLGSSLLAAWLPRAREIHADSGVLLAALVSTLLAVVLAGLVPAVRGGRSALQTAIQEGGRGGAGAQGQGLRRAFVVAEIAMSLALLIGAGLLIRSFSHLLAISPGCDPDGVVVAGIQLPASRYPTDPAIAGFFDRLIERMAALPGVTAAGVGDTTPFGGSNINGDLEIEGRPQPRPGEAITAEKRVASSGYFRALRIPLLAGRLFDAGDRAGTSTVLVNEHLARFAWPHESAIGKRIAWERGRWLTVVGVVGNVHVDALDDAPTLDTYVPYAARPIPGLQLVVRSDPRLGDPLRLAAQLRAEVLAIDRDQPISNVDLLSNLMQRSFAGRRFHMLLVGAFAFLALLLASLGIYGVMSYAVAQRTREIAVRIAVGAGRREVCGLLLGNALSTTAAGVAAGLLLAFALARGLESLLFGTASHDPAVFTGAALLLTAVALFASLPPMLRALRVDPVRALRGE